MIQVKNSEKRKINNDLSNLKYFMLLTCYKANFCVYFPGKQFCVLQSYILNIDVSEKIAPCLGP